MKHTIEQHNASFKHLRDIILNLAKVNSSTKCLNIFGIKTRNSKKLQSEINKLLKSSYKMFSASIRRYQKEYSGSNELALTGYWGGVKEVLRG